MTARTKPLPKHGTTARYDRGCHEACCRDVHNAARRRRYRLQGYGQWQPFTEAEPVRQHVRNLMTAGVGWKRVAKLAGVHASVVSLLLYGKNGRLRPTLRTENAEKILAVKPPTAHTVPDNKPVDNVGTRRRLEALGCRGYSCARIAQEVGVWPETARAWLHGGLVEARHARAVAELFVRWEMRDAEANGVMALTAAQTRARAKRLGWQPPMAWDLESIDDPDAQPLDWERSADRQSAAELIEDAEFIVRTTGVSFKKAADRLGVHRHTLEKARERTAARAKREQVAA